MDHLGNAIIKFNVYDQSTFKGSVSASVNTNSLISLSASPTFTTKNLVSIPTYNLSFQVAITCNLTTCISRKPNTTGCYSSFDTSAHISCYQQLNTTDGKAFQSCGTSCPSNYSTANVSSGKCVLKSCSSRTANVSLTFPCLTSNCYQQMNDGTPQTTCETSCPSTAHTEADPSSGKCVLKTCTARVYDASASYSCGSSDCYLLDNKTCSSLCPSAHYSVISTTYSFLQLDNQTCDFSCPGADYDSNSTACNCTLINCYLRDRKSVV